MFFCPVSNTLSSPLVVLFCSLRPNSYSVESMPISVELTGHQHTNLDAVTPHRLITNVLTQHFEASPSTGQASVESQPRLPASTLNRACDPLFLPQWRTWRTLVTLTGRRPSATWPTTRRQRQPNMATSSASRRRQTPTSSLRSTLSRSRRRCRCRCHYHCRHLSQSKCHSNVYSSGSSSLMSLSRLTSQSTRS